VHKQRESPTHRSISSPSASEQKYRAIGFYVSLLMAKFLDVDNYYFIRGGFLLFSFLLCLCVIPVLLEDSSVYHNGASKGRFIIQGVSQCSP
jgi:hypothetical protein